MADNPHERLKEIAAEYGMAEDAQRPMEFFFYAPSEDAAANLSISLHQLGYTIYPHPDGTTEGTRISVTGRTPMMSTETEVLTQWYRDMATLAESHNCEFDGYGTLITEPEEGWDLDN